MKLQSRNYDISMIRKLKDSNSGHRNRRAISPEQ
jgi:hypothetical protein